jgi:hypothetical protein
MENKRLFTIENWLNLPEGEICELIEGDLVYKSSPTSDHSDSRSAIDTMIKNEFQWKRKGADGWWIRAEISAIYQGKNNGFIHDLAGWKKINFPEKPRGKKTIERPDWVCEILNENEETHLEVKKRILHENGVPIVWIVDLKLQKISVFQWGPMSYVLKEDVHVSEKKALEPFDLEFSISVLLGNEPE